MSSDTRGAADTRAVIGLEIHVQLDTRTKLFCGDAVTHDAPPNTQVCPVCLGLPGALPVLNERAVELGVRAAAVLHADIQKTSRFVRKNYFYPDLPKGYQITQLDEPLAFGGELHLSSGAAVRISRIHLEEDAGKLLHDRIPTRTAIDLNRCGIPLLEVVTEPDLHSAADAADAARQLRHELRYAGVSECDMERGGLRIDANVSVGNESSRTELKNINSFTQLERAIDAELARQRAIVEAGGHVGNDTLTWDADAGELRIMRSKEPRSDYRYFTDPDVPTLVLDDALIERSVAGLPETPSARSARFRQEMTLPESSARSLAATRAIADYFEDVIAAGASAHAAAAWTLTHVLAWCNSNVSDIARYPVTAGRLGDIAKRAEHGTITRDGARRILAVLEAGDGDVDEIVHRLGLSIAQDDAALNGWIDEVMAAEAPLVTRYRNGEANLFGFLMGRLMQRAGASVEPGAAADMLRTRLGG